MVAVFGVVDVAVDYSSPVGCEYVYVTEDDADVFAEFELVEVD